VKSNHLIKISFILKKILRKSNCDSALKGYHFIVLKFKINSAKLIKYLIDEETGIFTREITFLQ